MKSVMVLMSTYNGEKYVEEQIVSIMQQVGVEVDLLIRDDGSSDNTVNIIKKLTQKYPQRVFFYVGENKGYIYSFFDLLRRAPKRDYYAFADQDDFWLETKIISAVNFLNKENEDISLCYHGWRILVNEDMEVLNDNSKILFPKNKYMAIFQNYVQGATMVINNVARDNVINRDIPQNVAHDIWIPLVCEFLGKVVFDYEPQLLYRRHNMAVTAKKNRFEYYIKRIDDLKKGTTVINLSKYLLNNYGEQIDYSDCVRLRVYANCKESIKNRVYMVLDKDVRRYTIRGTVLLKLCVLMGKMEG